ncbi:MAG: HAMP domain-containing sensor histidine kinase [Desulfobacterales bacterium]
MGNVTQIHQMIMNLCTNAADAMEENGGTLNVSLEKKASGGDGKTAGLHSQPGDYLEIRVSDTGVGIARENIESIFNPYFTTKEGEKGTGLGLSVVHGIVETHGGKISVESSPGNGTCFTICLPVLEKTIPETKKYPNLCLWEMSAYSLSMMNHR